MITIVVTHEDDQSDEFDFSPSQPTITIGRRSTNDVCIPNLSVSGRHARIAFSKGEAWVEDLNSTNGTYINNRLISRQILNNNDELVIGKTRVRFFDSANQKVTIQSAPAEVIDIRSPDPSMQDAEPAQFSEMDEHDNSELDLSDTGSPAPDAHYNDDGLDELLGDKKPDNSVIAGSAMAAGAAGIAAVAATSQSVSEASDSESLFEALADDLSERDKGGYSNRNTAEAAPASAESNNPLDDSGEMSLSDRAKVALGRNSSNTSRAEIATEAADEPVDLAAHRKGKNKGATIEIKNGAKSGHIIPIDKPVTTLGRPGIQIAAIMRKPDGYFLMHIESNDSVDRPTLNNDFIGDEPMLLHPGDEMNVAGINVEFDLVSNHATTTV